MYNIHNHYSNIYEYAKSINKYISLVSLHPFGSSNPENVEILGEPHPGEEYDNPYVSPISRHGPIIFCYDQEPLNHDFNYQLFKHVVSSTSWLVHYSNPQCTQPMILVNTEMDSDEKNKILNEFGFIDCPYFYHAFAAADWFRGYQYHTGITPVLNRKLNKKFITFNRITSNARVYRSLVINELIEHQILGQGHVSFSKSCPDGAAFDVELTANEQLYQIPHWLVTQTINNINTQTHSFRIDHNDCDYIPNSSFEINSIPENMESFVHVVTETCFWGRKKHLTEKIFKPIALKQPFILVGCAHNLEYLKQYGFKTFDKWWDESYDCIENDVQRIHSIGALLSDICKKDLAELTEMLHQMNDVLEFNHRRFYSQEFLNDCWGEVTTQLEKSVRYDFAAMNPTPRHELICDYTAMPPLPRYEQTST